VKTSSTGSMLAAISKSSPVVVVVLRSLWRLDTRAAHRTCIITFLYVWSALRSPDPLSPDRTYGKQQRQAKLNLTSLSLSIYSEISIIKDQSS